MKIPEYLIKTSMPGFIVGAFLSSCAHLLLIPEARIVHVDPAPKISTTVVKCVHLIEGQKNNNPCNLESLSMIQTDRSSSVAFPSNTITTHLGNGDHVELVAGKCKGQQHRFVHIGSGDSTVKIMGYPLHEFSENDRWNDIEVEWTGKNWKMI
jgi:hypothetical protein